MIFQRRLTLRERRPGYHLITREVIESMPEIRQISTEMCQVFIQHTSAGLCINENANLTVRIEFETYFNKAVPENDPDYRHDYEGSDDTPAHLKSAMLGRSVLIPVSQGQLALGMWQGIYLCEFRNRGGESDVVITCWEE